jgi:23S rRNA (cytosine1962-C5)-methyltransferase
VRHNSKSKKVLNLFSYTGGLSVNAALGQASEVTTVDVSNKFLNWSRENFKLNSLNPEKYEFFCQDSILFLKGAVKRNRKWDLIICDPPSFGRSKDGVWKLEQNISELAVLLMSCLSLKGRILFTCNLEKLSRSDLLKLFCKNLKKYDYSTERVPMMNLDFEETDDLKNLMKGFFIIQN